MALRLVFADDDYLVREGMAALLGEVDDLELVDAVADAEALLRSVAQHRPDAVLTDIRMPPRLTTKRDVASSGVAMPAAQPPRSGAGLGSLSAAPLLTSPRCSRSGTRRASHG